MRNRNTTQLHPSKCAFLNPSNIQYIYVYQTNHKPYNDSHVSSPNLPLQACSSFPTPLFKTWWPTHLHTFPCTRIRSESSSYILHSTFPSTYNNIFFFKAGGVTHSMCLSLTHTAHRSLTYNTSRSWNLNLPQTLYSCTRNHFVDDHLFPFITAHPPAQLDKIRDGLPQTNSQKQPYTNTMPSSQSSFYIPANSPWRLDGSSVASGVMLQKSNASPIFGFTDNPPFPHSDNSFHHGTAL